MLHSFSVALHPAYLFVVYWVNLLRLTFKTPKKSSLLSPPLFSTNVWVNFHTMRSVNTVRNTLLKSSLSLLFRLPRFPLPRFQRPQWSSDWQCLDITARAEQCSQDRPAGSEAIACTAVTASTALAASSSQNWLQAGCDDLQDSTPSYLTQHIKLCQSVRTLRSSDVPLLDKPTIRTEFAKRSFRYSATSVWNLFPTQTVNSNSLTTFRSRLKSHFSL